MKYLLDTNVISEMVAKQPDPKVIAWIDSLDQNWVYLSVITIGELRKGIEKLPSSRRKERLRAWLADELLVRFSGRILSLDIDVMLAWGELTGRLEARGKPLPAIDSLIAALALHHTCHLLHAMKPTSTTPACPYSTRGSSDRPMSSTPSLIPRKEILGWEQ